MSDAGTTNTDADGLVGAGVVGVSRAHYLSTKHNMSVLLVDGRPPLSYTSAMSQSATGTSGPTMNP